MAKKSKRGGNFYPNNGLKAKVVKTYKEDVEIILEDGTKVVQRNVPVTVYETVSSANVSNNQVGGRQTVVGLDEDYFLDD